MRLALVTGGAGFIGSHLVERILARGTSVRVLDNLSGGSLRNLRAAVGRGDAREITGDGKGGGRLELVVGDVCDEKLVKKALRGADCVFHLAAVPPPCTALGDGAWIQDVNVQGTLNVLGAAALEGARRVVFASCASVYGGLVSTRLCEASPTQPRSLFAASKLAGEIYCRAYGAAQGLETVVLRYFQVYGPRQVAAPGGPVVPALIHNLRRGRRPVLYGDGRGLTDLLYVDDAVAATVAAGYVVDASGHTVNVAAGHATTGLEVLEILKRLRRSDAVPRLVRARVGQWESGWAETRLAREILGFEARISLVTGLARTLEVTADADDGEAEEGVDERILETLGPREERPYL